jgi:hypothetical protein
MNAPVIVIHTLVRSTGNPCQDHPNIDYQITEDGNTYKKNESFQHPHSFPAAIHIGFHCKARGGFLTEAQYHAGLGLILEIATQRHFPIPISRDSILNHHDLDAAHSHSCPGPFFPWVRLMNDLQKPHSLVPIYCDGTPIAIGYLKRGTTYVPVQKLAKALGFSVQWDGVKNRIELNSDS